VSPPVDAILKMITDASCIFILVQALPICFIQQHEWIMFSGWAAEGGERLSIHSIAIADQDARPNETTVFNMLGLAHEARQRLSVSVGDRAGQRIHRAI
jgi:hypothetical protein